MLLNVRPLRFASRSVVKLVQCHGTAACACPRLVKGVCVIGHGCRKTLLPSYRTVGTMAPGLRHENDVGPASSTILNDAAVDAAATEDAASPPMDRALSTEAGMLTTTTLDSLPLSLHVKYAMTHHMGLTHAAQIQEASLPRLVQRKDTLLMARAGAYFCWCGDILQGACTGPCFLN